MLHQLNFKHSRTLERAKRCVTFFETIKAQAPVPITTADIDKFTSSGSCKTGAALRSVLVKSASARQNIPAAYSVNEAKLTQLKNMIKEYDNE